MLKTDRGVLKTKSRQFVWGKKKKPFCARTIIINNKCECKTIKTSGYQHVYDIRLNRRIDLGTYAGSPRGLPTFLLRITTCGKTTACTSPSCKSPPPPHFQTRVNRWTAVWYCSSRLVLDLLATVATARWGPALGRGSKTYLRGTRPSWLKLQPTLDERKMKK